MSSLSNIGQGRTLSRGYYGGSEGANYRRQAEAYDRGVRQLRRASRRGDTGAALKEISLRDKANAARYTPGGIRDRQEFQSGLAGSIARREQMETDRRRDEEFRRKDTERKLGDLDAAEDAVRNPPGEPDSELPRETTVLGEQAEDENPLTFVDDDTTFANNQTTSRLGLPRMGSSLDTVTKGAGRGKPLGRSRLLDRRLV